MDMANGRHTRAHNYSFHQKNLALGGSFQKRINTKKDAVEIRPFDNTVKSSHQQRASSASVANKADSDMTSEETGNKNEFVPRPPSSPRSGAKGRPNFIGRIRQNVHAATKNLEHDLGPKLNSNMNIMKPEQSPNESVDKSLINSYEDYLRDLTLEEEAEYYASSSDEDGSSDDSISVSSMSDNGDLDSQDENFSKTTDLNVSANADPLYSLPIKSKKNKSTSQDFDATKSSHTRTIKQSVSNEPAVNSKVSGAPATLNDSLANTSSLRTRSAPNIRDLTPTGMLDSKGYVCPINSKNTPNDRTDTLRQNNVSSPELRRIQRGTFDLRFRPLPSIPFSHTSSPRTQDTSSDLYESIKSNEVPQSNHQLSKSGKHISFKTVANTVASMVPRVTTQEARNRQMDESLTELSRYLPDNKLRIFIGTWNMKGTRVCTRFVHLKTLLQKSFTRYDLMFLKIALLFISSK